MIVMLSRAGPVGSGHRQRAGHRTRRKETLLQLNTAVYHASFYPCTLDGAAKDVADVLLLEKDLDVLAALADPAEQPAI